MTPAPAVLVATVQMERALARLRELRETAPEVVPPAVLTDRQRRMCVRQLRYGDDVVAQARYREGVD